MSNALLDLETRDSKCSILAWNDVVSCMILDHLQTRSDEQLNYFVPFSVPQVTGQFIEV